MIDFLYVVLAGVYNIGNTFVDFIMFDTGYHAAFFSAVAAGIGGLLGLGSQKSANKANLQATRETNEMNYKMFKEANAFNEYMSDKAWDRETAYNDPAAQLERYKNAGINGQVAMSGSLGSAGNTPADYAAASSVAPPMFQAPTVQPLNMTPFAEAAAAVAQLAQAKKAGAETRSIDTMIDETLEGFKLDNDAKRMANDIVRKYGHAQASENLAKTSAEVSKIWAEYDFAIKNGEYTDELRNKTIEEVKRIIAEADLKKKEAEYLQKEIDWYDAKAEQDIKESQSRAHANEGAAAAGFASANASNASANASNAQADYTRSLKNTEDALREYKVTEAESDAAYRDVINALNALNLQSDERKKYLDAYYSGGLHGVIGRLVKSMKDEVQLEKASREFEKVFRNVLNRRKK